MDAVLVAAFEASFADEVSSADATAVVINGSRINWVDHGVVSPESYQLQASRYRVAADTMKLCVSSASKPLAPVRITRTSI